MASEQEFQERVLQIKRGRKGEDAGRPCYWENVKDFEQMTRITFILDSFGNTLIPIYTKYDTGDKLIPITDNDYIVKIFLEKDKLNKGQQLNTIDVGVGVSILRIREIDKYSNKAIVDLVMRKPSEGTEWLKNTIVDLPTNDVEKIILNKLHTIIEGFKL